MTQQLADLLNLPDIPTQTNVVEELVKNTMMLAKADTINDRIDIALSSVHQLAETDSELDDLSDMARKKFEELIDLGLNVEPRLSGPILATASSLLGHAIAAKQSKIDRKLRTIDLQLKKLRIDAQQSQKTDGQKLLDSTDADGSGTILDRNTLLAQILRN